MVRINLDSDLGFKLEMLIFLIMRGLD